MKGLAHSRCSRQPAEADSSALGCRSDILSETVVVGGCSGSRWCRLQGIWVRRRLCAALQDRKGHKSYLSWGPLKASSAKGQGLWPRGGCGDGELEPGSPSVIYGGAGNEAGWQ